MAETARTLRRKTAGFAALTLICVLGCDDAVKLEHVLQGAGPSFEVVNTFGQLIQVSPSKAAHYLAVQLDLATTEVLTPSTGEIFYVDSLDGLSECLVLTPKLRDDDDATSFGDLGPGLSKPETLRIALCNLDKTGATPPLEQAVQTLYTEAGADDPAAETTEFFNLATDKDDRTVDVWAAPEATFPDPAPTDDKRRWSRLGKVVGGVLHLGVFSEDDDGHKTYLNPAAYLAKIPLSPPATALRRSTIAEIKTESASDVNFTTNLRAFDFDTTTGTMNPNENVGGFLRFFFRLTNNADDGGSTKLVAPYEISYSLSEVTGGTPVVRSHGRFFMNAFASHPTPIATHLQNFGDALYRTPGTGAPESSPGGEQLWLRLPIDPTVVSADDAAPLHNLGDLSGYQTFLNLDSSSGGSRQFPAGDYELEIILANAFDVAVSDTKVVRFSVNAIPVDLDVDTDMDGTIDATDDAAEMNDRAIIVNVNNNDSDGDSKRDSANNAIDGATDKTELTPLWLRQISNVPAGGKVELSIREANPHATAGDAKKWLRIFDDTDAGVIGPPAGDGGPNKSKHVVPRAKIVAGDLKYLIEAIDHGNAIVSLSVLDAANNVLGQDEVKVVLNVDQNPSGGAVRFRINGSVSRATADLTGIRADIETPLAKVNYAPTIRKFSSTNVWVSVQNMNTATGSHWIQSGLAVDRSVGAPLASAVEAIYFEAVVKFGAAGYQRHYVFKTTAGANDPWPNSGKFEVRIDDPATGKVVASLDGTDWNSWIHVEWKTRTLINYQIGTEMFHSVDQQPGTAADKCEISNAEIRVGAAWSNTAFSNTNVLISDYDKNGTETNPASSHELQFSGLSATGWDMWDKMVEY